MLYDLHTNLIIYLLSELGCANCLQGTAGPVGRHVDSLEFKPLTPKACRLRVRMLVWALEHFNGI